MLSKCINSFGESQRLTFGRIYETTELLLEDEEFLSVKDNTGQKRIYARSRFENVEEIQTLKYFYYELDITLVDSIKPIEIRYVTSTNTPFFPLQEVEKMAEEDWGICKTTFKLVQEISKEDYEWKLKQ